MSNLEFNGTDPNNEFVIRVSVSADELAFLITYLNQTSRYDRLNGFTAFSDRVDNLVSRFEAIQRDVNDKLTKTYPRS